MAKKLNYNNCNLIRLLVLKTLEEPTTIKQLQIVNSIV